MLDIDFIKSLNQSSYVLGDVLGELMRGVYTHNYVDVLDYCNEYYTDCSVLEEFNNLKTWLAKLPTISL